MIGKVSIHLHQKMGIPGKLDLGPFGDVGPCGNLEHFYGPFFLIPIFRYAQNTEKETISRLRNIYMTIQIL